MIGLEPTLVGGVQLKVTELAVIAELASRVGAAGALPSVVALTVDVAALVPMLLVAETLKSYEVTPVRPVTVADAPPTVSDDQVELEVGLYSTR